MERPCIGQGRAGLRRKELGPINQPINQPSDLSQKTPGRRKIEKGKTNPVHTRDLTHSINNANEKMTNNNTLIPEFPIVVKCCVTVKTKYNDTMIESI